MDRKQVEIIRELPFNMADGSVRTFARGAVKALPVADADRMILLGYARACAAPAKKAPRRRAAKKSAARKR